MPIEMGQFDVQFRGDEANRIFMEPVFFDQNVLQSFRLMPDVVNQKKMAFAQKLERVIRRYTGCGFTPVGGLNVYERTVRVNNVKADVELCMDEFIDTVWEELLKRGTSIHDLTGTLMETILLERLRQAILLDVERLYFFGDESSANPDYDAVDGLWNRRLVDLVTDNLVPYHDTGSGTALTAGEGISRIQTVYDNAPNQLMGLPNDQKRIMVSGTVFRQFREDVEALGGGDAGRVDELNGREVFTYRGVQIVPMWRWNHIMESDFSSADAHLVLFTSPQNLVLATDVVNPQTQFRVWYDEDDEKLKAKIRFKLGCDYVHHELMSVGY